MKRKQQTGKVVPIAWTILLILGIIWAAFSIYRGKSYSHPSVVGVIRSAAASSGFVIVEERNIRGELRARSYGGNHWLQNWFGTEVFDSHHELTLVDGTMRITVLIAHRGGQAGRVEIRPGIVPSSSAESLRWELIKAFPKIKCVIVEP